MKPKHFTPSNHRWMLGSTLKANQHNQVILRMAKDYKIENGFILNKEIALRWILMRRSLQTDREALHAREGEWDFSLWTSNC